MFDKSLYILLFCNDTMVLTCFYYTLILWCPVRMIALVYEIVGLGPWNSHIYNSYYYVFFFTFDLNKVHLTRYIRGFRVSICIYVFRKFPYCVLIIMVFLPLLYTTGTTQMDLILNKIVIFYWITLSGIIF